MIPDAPVSTSSPRRPTGGFPRAARIRAYVAAALIGAGFMGVGYKAYAVQVKGGATFKQQAARQHTMTMQVAAPRGAIVDAQGRALAVTADADSIWVNPRAITDLTGTAQALADLIGADVRMIEDRLAGDKHFAWIARHVSPEVAAKVRAAKLLGVEVVHEPRRWYPGRSTGGPLLGVSNIDGQGLEGIELALDDELTGERAKAPALRDARGRTMLADGLIEAQPGATVTLTIDRTIQAIADQALATAVASAEAVGGTAVVLDVQTGKVLAMSSVPTFDPNHPGAHLGARNRAVTDVFEIGSLMKIITVASALDAGVIRADERWNTVSFRIGSKAVRDVHPYPSMTTGQILKHSSNVGAVRIAQRLGRTRFHEALRRFGFATPTGIELPGERAGTLRDGSKWREIELATISFGYGLTVTPLQMAAALAAIGNHGQYNAPRLIERVTAADGTLVRAHLPAPRQVMTPASADAMLPMLASTFERTVRGSESNDPAGRGGTAAAVVVPGFLPGGKTGTAHKLDPATKRYAPDLYLASFAGLVPIANPRLAIVVLIDEPKGKSYFGGKVAGPVFGTIASEALRYLGVPGDAPVEVAATSASKRAADDVLDDADAAADATLPLTDDDVAVDPNVVPDFTGLGLAEALELARSHGLTLDTQGRGVVTTQSVPPGTDADGAIVRVQLGAPALPR